jgi:hypothetical protein
MAPKHESLKRYRIRIPTPNSASITPSENSAEEVDGLVVYVSARVEDRFWRADVLQRFVSSGSVVVEQGRIGVCQECAETPGETFSAEFWHRTGS